MRKVREILRLRHEQGLTQRQISASTGVSKGAVGEYLRRADKAALTWEQARPLDDGAIEARLFRLIGRNEPTRRVPIDFPWVHRELRRTGVTLQQLWIEYREAAASTGAVSGAAPYSYSQFCDRYATFRAKVDVTMRQVITIIVMVRLRWHQPTKDYMARRTTEGKSKREIIRCLKRYVAREVYAVLRSMQMSDVATAGQAPGEVA